MKTNIVLTLALIAGCSQDYSIIAPDPEIPKETVYEQDKNDAPYPEVNVGDAGDTGAPPPDDDVVEPTPEGDDAGGPPADESEPVDTDSVEEEPHEDPLPEEDPPADPPPPDPCASADADGDGHDAPGCGGDDCDDSDPTIHPLGGDVWNDDVDSDCDGLNCNAGWVGDGYFAACPTGIPQSHDSATDLCIAGGHDGLASMRTPEEGSFVLSLRPLTTGLGDGVYRIGLTTETLGGTWSWDDGTPLSWSGWAPGQPTFTHTGSDEFCGTIYPSDMPTYLGPNKWNDMKCGVHGEENKSIVCGTRG